MKPVEFEGMNCIYAKNQPKYLPLPAHRTATGEVISCWELSEDEIKQVLEIGKIYLTLLTFNQPLQPILMSVLKPEIGEVENGK